MTPVPTSPGRMMQHLLQKYPRAADAEPNTEILSEQQLLDILLGADDMLAPETSLATFVEQAIAGRDEHCDIAPDHSAIIEWFDATFAALADTALLDAALESRIQGMRAILAALAISERDFLLPGKHPAHKMLDEIYDRGIGWHAGLGRAGKMITDKLDDIEGALRSQLTEEPLDLAQLSTEVAQSFERELTAFTRLRDRLIATEQGRLKADSARISVAEALNELILGGQIPAAVNDFLRGPWLDSMQLTLIKHGREHDLWQRMLKITETLVWTVQPSDSMTDARRQRLYKIIPQLPRELFELLISLDNNAAEKEHAVAQIEEIHFQILRKQKLERLEPEPILTGPTKIITRVAEQLLEQVLPLQEGQWFKISSEQDKQSRIYLALKLDEYQQMLFVNRAGARALQKTFEEFSYLLSTGVAEPLPPSSGFSKALHACAGLEKAIESEELSYRKPRKAVIFRSHTPNPSATEATADADAPDLAGAAESTPELERDATADADGPNLAGAAEGTPELESEATLAAEETAAPETELEAGAELLPGGDADLPPGPGTQAETLAGIPEPEPQAANKEPADAPAEAAPAPTAKAPEEEVAVSTDLPIGTWVKFHDTDGKPAKLAVRVESLDKFIFVDGRGVKKREFKTVQLQMMLDNGRAEVLGTSSNFADTVSNIVKGFRSSDSQED
jgi:hypothetical protein